MLSWISSFFEDPNGNNSNNDNGNEKSKKSGPSMMVFGSQMAFKKQAEKTKHKKYDLLFKIVLLGDSGSGKSALLTRFVTNQFHGARYKSTIGADFMSKHLLINDQSVVLQLWDTSGQERFQSISISYYRGADMAFIVFDMSNRKSFEHVTTWMEEVRAQCPESVQVIVVGNKTDLQQVVHPNEAKKLAESLGIPILFTSALSGENVEKAFMTLTHMALKERTGEDAMEIQELSKEHMERRRQQSDDESDEETFDEEDLDAELGKLMNTNDNTNNNKVKNNNTNSNTNNSINNNKSNAKQKQKKHDKTDVNVFQLDLTSLEQGVDVLTGDPILCKHCGIILSIHSKISSSMSKTEIEKILDENRRRRGLQKKALVPAPPLTEKYLYLVEGSKDSHLDSFPMDATHYWRCEFCGNLNALNDVNPDELPQSTVVDYIVTPPPIPRDKGVGGKDCNVVFCIDTSGSMCVTEEVPGSLKLKGFERREKENKDILSENGNVGIASQYLPNQKKNITHVSRLQSVQSAIETQIESLAKDHPNVHVCLITFDSEVTLIGDGVQTPVVVAGDKLDSWDDLLKIASEFPVKGTVKECKDSLLKSLWSLEESGSTALGPALLLGLTIASSKPRSKVILCTDGLANTGIGSLEGKEEDFAPFYTEVAEQAKVKAVTISVMTLTGTDCNVENLTVVTEQSGGDVDRVNPRNITSNMSSIMSTRVIAYGTMAMVLLHRGVRFRGEVDDEEENRLHLVKDLGNITAETECSFRYTFRSKSECDLSEVNEIPFQVQLLHTKENGMQCIRVATTTLSTTDDRQKAEQLADVKVIGSNAISRAAKYAKKGNYEEAQLEARAAQRFILRNNNNLDSKNSNSNSNEKGGKNNNSNNKGENIQGWVDQVESMDKVLRNEREKEKKMGVVTDSAHRQKTRNDDTATAISKVNAKKVW